VGVVNPLLFPHATKLPENVGAVAVGVAWLSLPLLSNHCDTFGVEGVIVVLDGIVSKYGLPTTDELLATTVPVGVPRVADPAVMVQFETGTPAMKTLTPDNAAADAPVDPTALVLIVNDAAVPPVDMVANVGIAI
jgi:hypothetical protein